MKRAVLYDFHGTLADVTAILPLVQARDYDGFYEQSLSCPPNRSVVLAAHQSHSAGYYNLLFTGMPVRYSSGLLNWLDTYDVHVDLLLMRTVEDGFRKDFVVKRRMYLEAVDQGYVIERAWEDSPEVIALLGQQGIPVVAIPRSELTRISDGVDTGSATP